MSIYRILGCTPFSVAFRDQNGQSQSISLERVDILEEPDWPTTIKLESARISEPVTGVMHGGRAPSVGPTRHQVDRRRGRGRCGILTDGRVRLKSTHTE